MSADSSKPTPDQRDPQIAAQGEAPDGELSEAEAKAVKTFSFEVSASNKAKEDLSRQPAKQSEPTAPSERNHPENPSADSAVSSNAASTTNPSPPQVREPSRSSKPKAKAENRSRSREGRVPTELNLDAGTALRPRLAEPGEIGSKQTVAPSGSPKILADETPIVKRARRGLPSSTISLIVHVLIILLLSIYTLGLPPKEEELGLFTSTAAYEEVEDFQDLEIDPSEDMEPLDSELTSELSDPGASSFGDLSAESALADVSGDSALSSDDIGEFGNLFGDAGTGIATEGEGLGAAATASFFGTKVEGRRILYMLDNSGGMKGGKFETLVEELLKSVESLQPKQQFYVIFYSDTVYPLFYPQSATNFVRATEKNRNFLREWLDTVELCTGNGIDEALDAAMVIRPDTVFLLTDGDLFTTKAKERQLLDGARRGFPINTFGMAPKEGSKFVGELRRVAEANRGTYRSIEISPEAKELAENKTRPYHKDGPGPIWGRNVK